MDWECSIARSSERSGSQTGRHDMATEDFSIGDRVTDTEAYARTLAPEDRGDIGSICDIDEATGDVLVFFDSGTKVWVSSKSLMAAE
jgi:hypothetical protein